METMKNKRNSIWTMLHNIPLALCLLLLSTTANAEIIEPENGWWINPEESGYGLNIELQADTLLVGIFSYDQNGNPIWYNAFGSYDNTTGAFSGTLMQFGQGPCLGCDYSAPQQTAGLGTIRMTFTNAWQGTVSWGSTSFSIERYNLARTDKAKLLLGGWNLDLNMLTDGVLFSSDLLDFYAVDTSGEVPLIHGYRITEPRLTASGYYYAEHDLFAVIVESPDLINSGSSNLRTYYEFTFDGLNSIRGAFWQVPRGHQPTGFGALMIGFRDVQFDNNPPSVIPDPIPPYPRTESKTTGQAASEATVARFNKLAKTLGNR